MSALLDAALVMPASLVAGLAPKIAKAVETPFWLPAEKMGRIAVNLASGGEHEAAFQLLSSLLKVIPIPARHWAQKKHGAVSVKLSLCYLRSTTALFCMFGEMLWLRISDCPISLCCAAFSERQSARN